VTFEYEADELPMKFIVKQRLTDYMTTSILGQNLEIKPVPRERGITEAPGTFVVNQDWNRTHLIPDWFGGSGYKESLNLISASAHFNQQVMGAAERAITAEAYTRNAMSFDMHVQVEWGEFIVKQGNTAVTKTIVSDAQGTQSAPRRQSIDKFIEEARQLNAMTPRRCNEVRYTVTFKDAKGDSIGAPFIRIIGPDQWMNIT
jgi:hypothetical protein